MTNDFSWLHISDLHLQSKNDWETREIIRKLIDDLKNVSIENEFYPNAVFFTGDAVFGNDGSEALDSQFAAFGDFLDEIRNAFDPVLPKNSIFCVPGNHDVDRGAILASDTAWLRSSGRSQAEIQAEISGETTMAKHWMSRLQKYREFLISYGLEHLAPERPNLIWTSSIDALGRKIGIAGLNTAWSCATNQEKGCLWMAGDWQIGTLLNQFEDCDLKIALLHHPSNWLSEDEDPYVHNRLLASFDIILHGHQHEEQISLDRQRSLLVGGGACYDTQKRPKGYSFGRLTLEGTYSKLWLRRWDELGRGWVARNIAHDAPHGTFRLDDLAANIYAASGKENKSNEVDENKGQIISISGTPSPESIAVAARRLKRHPVIFQRAHSRIRNSERSQFENLLSSDGIAWLAADWQMGKDGFIAAALNSLEGGSALDRVYRIDCGGVEQVDEIIEEAPSQIGVTFIEFSSIVQHFDSATLILDDVPAEIAADSTKRALLEDKLGTIKEFIPRLSVIVTTRFPPPSLNLAQVVSLKPLDDDDVRRYLSAGIASHELTRSLEIVEVVRSYTGGLPTAIDLLVANSQLVPLTEILEENNHSEITAIDEGIPTTLRKAVDDISAASDDAGKRTYSLLKLLAILHDGESFQSLRRMFPKKPFSLQHVSRLAQRGLIESIPIVRNSESLLPSKRLGTREINLNNEDRLLRLPPQVRQYVESLISSSERSRLYSSVSETMFGNKWYEGRIRLRRAIVIAHREGAVSGPGNELLVSKYLLKTAIERGNEVRIRQYSRLAVAYCTALLNEDRFRDCYIACRSMMRILNEVEHSNEWITCKSAYAKSARMIGEYDISTSLFRELLDSDSIRTKEFLETIHLSLAWNYESLSEDEKCLEHAAVAIDIAQKDSDTWFLAQSIIATIKLSGGKLQATRAELFRRARSKGCDNAANNIAISWAKENPNDPKALLVLDEVIEKASDDYNITRAIANKADLLRKSDRISDLSNDEQRKLCYAYEYCCAQRMGGLLDTCHEALWEFCLVRKFWKGMFKLFRFSSFVWCISNQSEKEKGYIEVLVAAKSDPDKVGVADMRDEIEYLERRSDAI